MNAFEQELRERVGTGEDATGRYYIPTRDEALEALRVLAVRKKDKISNQWFRLSPDPDAPYIYMWDRPDMWLDWWEAKCGQTAYALRYDLDENLVHFRCHQRLSDKIVYNRWFIGDVVVPESQVVHAAMWDMGIRRCVSTVDGNNATYVARLTAIGRELFPIRGREDKNELHCITRFDRRPVPILRAAEGQPRNLVEGDDGNAPSA